jgi:hypothetical protein
MSYTLEAIYALNLLLKVFNGFKSQLNIFFFLIHYFLFHVFIFAMLITQHIGKWGVPHLPICFTCTF